MRYAHKSFVSFFLKIPSHSFYSFWMHDMMAGWVSAWWALFVEPTMIRYQCNANVYTERIFHIRANCNLESRLNGPFHENDTSQATRVFLSCVQESVMLIQLLLVASNVKNKSRNDWFIRMWAWWVWSSMSQVKSSQIANWKLYHSSEFYCPNCVRVHVDLQ